MAIIARVKQENSDINFVGARKGASGSLEDLKRTPPTPKTRVNPELVKAVLERLKANQSAHCRLDLAGLINSQFHDADNDRYRIVWSRNMITAAGVSRMQKKGADPEPYLHFRDGEEECSGDKRWMRQILENLYAKGGRGKDVVEDFVYLTLVHEASEIYERRHAETLIPDLKAEVRAEIEEAKAYFSLPAERRKALRQLYGMLDETWPPRHKIYSSELELFERIGEENLATIQSLIAIIDFIVDTPDYVREAKHYPDERMRFQLSKSLFVDVIHNFASSSRSDQWVRAIENAGVFANQPVEYVYTENSRALSAQAEEHFLEAAKFIETLRREGAEPGSLPRKSHKKSVIDSFNNRMRELDAIKRRLQLNEVLSIPTPLREALEDNLLNRHFSYMDDYGIYHSFELSRLDLRGLNLHSGQDERTPKDFAQDINHYKDERSDLRGAQMVGSDVSGRANFSNAQMDFVNASYSNLSEINFVRTRARGMIFYGANANEAQFERALMNAVDARGMSANFARVQMKETEIDGMKIWQSDVSLWQRAYVDISEAITPKGNAEVEKIDRETLKAELDFLDDSFLDELDVIDEAETFQREESWIELREVEGQLEFLKGRGIVFYSREEMLEYSAK